MDDVHSCDIKLSISDMDTKRQQKTRFETCNLPMCSASQVSNNGESLVLFCSMNNLCIRYTYFVHISFHKKTWWSPDGSTSNEIDYLSISRQWDSAVLNVRAYCGVEIGLGHYLLMA